MQNAPISSAPQDLYYNDGGTCFYPAASKAHQLARSIASSHVPMVVFMSDGQASDATQAANAFRTLNSEIKSRTGQDLELHVIGFGSGANHNQLKTIAHASPVGKFRTSADTTDLEKAFVEIAGGKDVAVKLEGEIGKRISEAVVDKVALEFLR